MTLLFSALEQGMIYAIMALGIYITYKILDFPDLTVDGSFPMGAAITAALDQQRSESASYPSHVVLLAGAVVGNTDRSDPCKIKSA